MPSPASCFNLNICIFQMPSCLESSICQVVLICHLSNIHHFQKTSKINRNTHHFITHLMLSLRPLYVFTFCNNISGNFIIFKFLLQFFDWSDCMAAGNNFQAFDIFLHLVLHLRCTCTCNVIMK